MEFNTLKVTIFLCHRARKWKNTFKNQNSSWFAFAILIFLNILEKVLVSFFFSKKITLFFMKRCQLIIDPTRNLLSTREVNYSSTVGSSIFFFFFFFWGGGGCSMVVSHIEVCLYFYISGGSPLLLCGITWHHSVCPFCLHRGASGHCIAFGRSSNPNEKNFAPPYFGQ